jgi:hypothetical protein
MYAKAATATHWSLDYRRSEKNPCFGAITATDSTTESNPDNLAFAKIFALQETSRMLNQFKLRLISSLLKQLNVMID